MRPSAPFLGLVLAASGRDEIRKFLSRPHRFPQLLDVHLAQQEEAAADGDDDDVEANADASKKQSAKRASASARRESALDAFLHDDDDQDE